jgi:hypothetical protein
LRDLKSGNRAEKPYAQTVKKEEKTKAQLSD